MLLQSTDYQSVAKAFFFYLSILRKIEQFPLAQALLSYKISMDKNIVLWFSCFVV